MTNEFTKAQVAIHVALDDAFQRALKQEQLEGEIRLDVNEARLIIFSDHHRGNRDGADDFRICERAYNAALAYYDRFKYTLIVMGDVEELWEEWPQTVVKAYPHSLALEGKFHQDDRYIRLWGNHDDNWSHPDLVEQWLRPALGGGPLKVRESVILHLCDGNQELGRLFLTHGHQGTLGSDRIAPLSRFFVRYGWRPLQRIFKVSANSPAKSFDLRLQHETAMYLWSEAQKKTVLITGHTHRPVFRSERHEDSVRKSLEILEQKLLNTPGSLKMQQKAAEQAAELEWIECQNQQSVAKVPPIKFNKPSYFNTGCCAFLDGDVTGLELNEGEIRLVRWPDDDDSPKPKILVKTDLKKIFAAC